MQTRLMRVVEAREFRPLGGTQTRRLAARIIAASNVNLEQMIQKKEFRSDLYHRLNEYPIVLPLLRERKEDIPNLVRHFLDIERLEHRTLVTGISQEGLDLLQQQDWPGNVRELRNAIRHALVLNMDQNGLLSVDALSQHFGLSGWAQDVDRAYPARDLGATPTAQTPPELVRRIVSAPPERLPARAGRTGFVQWHHRRGTPLRRTTDIVPGVGEGK